MARVISAVLTLRDRNFASTANRAANNTRDLERRVRSAGNSITRFGRNATEGFSNATKSVLGFVAAYAGVSIIKDFGTQLVESAASAQATNAQFEQVFGDMQSGAQQTIDGLGQSFGMLSERLKPAFTTMTSMFKGLGLDTEDAMKTAESAVTLAADAAAFYDKSYEDANSALNSFIKGNYEGGESIGLFANETQLASWATKNLKVDWKNLNEAGKQTARLKFAQAMQESAGATGQAARESESYENQLGNLRSSWDTLKAKFGAPILQPVVKGLQALSKWISNIDTDSIINKFKKFGEIAKGAFDKIKPSLNWLKDTAFPMVVEGIKGVVDKAKSLYSFIKDNWSAIGPIVAGIAAGIISLKVGMAAISIATKTWAAVTTAAQIATGLLNGTLAVSPLGWIAMAIGAVVAIGIVMYKNWDTIRETASNLWTSLTEAWTGIKEGFSNMWTGIKDAAKAGVNFVIDKLNDLIEGFNNFASFKLPDWLGGAEFGVDIPTIPAYAKGTNYASGGISRINEQGGEIVDLPSGARVYPHDKSVQMARNEGKAVTVNVTINGSNLSVDQMANELVSAVKLRLANI